MRRSASSVLGILLGLLPTTVFAVGLYNPLGAQTLPQIIGRAVQFVFEFSGVLALLMVLKGGMTWLFAKGESAKIKEGMQTVLWACIGLVIIFGSYSIAKFIIDHIGLAAGGQPQQ